jgi:opacity protein-like surface antigen
MKRIILLTLLIALFVSAISAQENDKTQSPVVTLNSEPGYITINEFTGGFGLGVTSTPYSKGFFGFNTLHGYQVNKAFVVSGGTGIYFYNDGNLLPLLVDLRYRIHISRFTPYAFGEGGVLLDLSGKKDTRIFISPGAGVGYAINRNWAANLGAGLFVQFGTLRDSYFILKTGVVYKF